MKSFQAALWMTGTLLSFCVMAVAVRELSDALPVIQTLFYRSAIGLVLLLPLFFCTRQSFSSENLARHFVRNTFHLAGQYGWFLGIALLPLAQVFALEFTVPLWGILVAALFLKETITANKLAAVTLGLLGVLVIVRPGFETVELASFVVLGAAVCYAVAHTMTKVLSQTETRLQILFYMCLLQLPITFALSFGSWVWPQAEQWAWLALIAFTALSAHFCMTSALRLASVSTVLTLDFLRLPLISVVGVLLYSEPFDLLLLLGGGLMLCGNWLNLRPANNKHL